MAEGAEEIATLRRRRGIPRRRLTNLETWQNTHGNTADVFLLEAKLNDLQDSVNDFKELQAKLESLDPDECDKPDSDDFVSRASELRGKLSKLRYEAKLELSFVEPGNASGQTIIVDTSSQDLSNIKLEVFDGDYILYPSFIDSFNTMVHNNRSRGMNDLKRLAILKSHLGPNVMRSMQHFKMTAENYQAFLKALDDRYGKPRMVFEKFISDLHRLQKATNNLSLRSLSDGTTGILKSLESMATSEQIKDGLLIYLILGKCDHDTIARWEDKASQSNELPKWEEFHKFLENRCTSLECTQYASSLIIDDNLVSSTPIKSNVPLTVTTANMTTACKICGNKCKDIEACTVYNNWDAHQRFNRIKALNLCIKCLGDRSNKGHSCKDTCEICNKGHHKSLHFNDKNTLLSKVDERTTTLLATVKVLIKGEDNRDHTYRALLDSGSQVNFLSSRAYKQLGLRAESTNLSINGIHGQAKIYEKQATFEIRSAVTEFKMKISAAITHRIGGCYPASKIDSSSWEIPKNCELADPEFNLPQKVDLILSAEVFYKGLSVGQLELGANKPIAQKTLFGWILAGSFSTLSTNLTPSTSFSASAILKPELDWMKKFWELEEIKPVNKWSIEEKQCEHHFIKTVQRNEEGRFIIKLPFKNDPSMLGPSRKLAISRLISIERKLSRSPEDWAAYHDFMDEYESLGHMQPLPLTLSNQNVNVLSHFFVKNVNSTTTPLRVVFDASCKTESGYSLNDILMVGPCLQAELFVHLIRFRSYNVAVVGDMSKMYRQILVDKDDRKYQCILWRDEQERIVVKQLNTVTYGTAPASFIAQRCLQWLAESTTDLSAAASVVSSHFYMDDMLSGSSTVAEAVTLVKEVQQLLNRGGFPLKKIMSNKLEVLEQFEEGDVGGTVQLGDRNIVSTLGIKWVPAEDQFVYQFEAGTGPITKRKLLSEVGRIFDPLGLLQPIIVIAKILIQHLWSLGLDWDETVPQAIATTWETFRQQLSDLSELKTPRLIILPEATSLEYHCFVDASEKAYAACIYILSKAADAEIKVQLLCAKTRVAPLKVVSLARLELCAALLGAELLEAVKTINVYQVNRIVCWSDSTTALKWIRSSPHLWKTFVATRVTKIQHATHDAEWRHVPGEMNPADIGSRGCQPAMLAKHTNWFDGPNFLRQSENNWPEQKLLPAYEQVPEGKPAKLSWLATVETDEVEACKFNDWCKLKRVFAYMTKFTYERVVNRSRVEHNRETTANLSVTDLVDGEILMVKLVQKQQFAIEISLIKNSNPLPKKSALRTLNPFIDHQGLLRVGGRLENANHLTYDAKHPIILPKSHKITKSLVFWYHSQLHHVGPTSLLTQIRMKYWPIQAKTVVNNIVYNCVRCRKVKPIIYQQIMGDLPEDRVSKVQRCFIVTGIDFLGPIKVHYKGRGTQPTDAYVAVFVCFASKAVHFEVVENLTTDAFLCALRRFVARYGPPKTIWSDNAKNFIGAANELKELNELLASKEHWQQIYQWARDQKGIEWRFIPPRSPHWGGIWEAAVKSAKYHLKRTIGKCKLTITELWTYVSEIATILNMRPMIPVAFTPDENKKILTAHDLMNGLPMTVAPEPVLSDVNLGYQKRWKIIAALRQSFWNTWSTEYLQTLQQRYKWCIEKEPVKVDDVVLLVDNNVPSYDWALGRIIETYPGKDRKIRVVKVKTAYGEYVRAITKLCKLPLEED